jgi:hypothetical protein
MKPVDLDDYIRQVICTYRGENYLVRDNGAVFRQPKDTGRKRPLDEKWTFGRADKKAGYMFISSVGIHLIVATAYHGPKPSKDHVVDHIDTNRRNNRPENLRWVTRLENLLLNPITRRRIEIAYGSIENFHANPAQPISGKLHPNFEWMRSVTKHEAEACRRRLLDWANSERMPSGGVLGEWVYTPLTEQYVEEPQPDDLIESNTPGATQRNWKTPSEFPLCPSEISTNGLDEYRKRLKKGEVFSRNRYGEAIVDSADLSEDSETLVVLSKHPGGVKDWSLARVLVEDELFVHEALGTFFTLEGATKQYVIKRGLNWEGGDTIDDYC